MRRLVLALAVSAVVGMIPAGAAIGASAPVITWTCNPGPDDCSGWYRSNVTITWQYDPTGVTYANCPTITVDADTSGNPVTCTVKNSVAQSSVTVTLRRDATPPTMSSASPNRGPDANGWYNQPLSVSFGGTDATSGIASCTNASYSGPDSSGASISGSCTDVAGNTSAALSFAFRYDATAPSVAAAAARQPDANGWYNHPVGIAFSGSDSTSGVAGCTSATYSGPDTASASVSGTCRDEAGNTGSATGVIQYDATPPQLTGATPSRPPDANGWYNHPATFAFAGTDATSGIDTCSAVEYKGPDSAKASVKGTCRDKAGNAAGELTVPLKYDATAPIIQRVEATPGDRKVVLRWTATGGVALVLVERTIVRRGAKPAVVYRGHGKAFVDKRVRNGAKYRYRIVAVDEAGNSTGRAAVVTPQAPLASPPDGARVRPPVLLRWQAVKRAAYYNVQLRVDGVKILSLWPASPRLLLPRHWVFQSVAHDLRPGRYRWDVWPGFGPRSAARYGKRIGTSTFVVTR